LSRKPRISRLYPNRQAGQESYASYHPIGPFNPCMGFWRALAGMVLFALACGIVYYRDGRGWTILAVLFVLGAALILTIGKEKCDPEYCNCQSFQHNSVIVQQKLLTLPNYCFTVIARGLDMANTPAVGLHFAYYNFVKRHNTLRYTPAMAAGVTGTTWSVADLVEATA
jgi:hypothetical protein